MEEAIARTVGNDPRAELGEVLTHIKRLLDTDRARQRLYEALRRP